MDKTIMLTVMQRAQALDGRKWMAAQHDGGKGEELHKAWSLASMRGYRLMGQGQDITPALADICAAAHAFMDYVEARERGLGDAAT